MSYSQAIVIIVNRAAVPSCRGRLSYMWAPFRTIQPLSMATVTSPMLPIRTYPPAMPTITTTTTAAATVAATATVLMTAMTMTTTMTEAPAIPMARKVATAKKCRLDKSPSFASPDDGHADGHSDNNIAVNTSRPHKRQYIARADMMLVCRQNLVPSCGGPSPRSSRRAQTAAMLSTPASRSLSESKSDTSPDCSRTLAVSFGIWQLQNAALKCVTIDWFTTYQLEFQRAQAHYCSRRRERRSHKQVISRRRDRKLRDETKGRRCGVCSQPRHNARTCQSAMETSNKESHR